jgi:hypothetical protein
MNWYVIPIFKETVEGGFAYYPGMGEPDSVVKCSVANYIAHAHDPKWNPTSVLLGLPTVPATVPSGWVSKTLEEAQAHFTSVVGRAPSEAEVF